MVHPPQNGGPVKFFAKLRGSHLLMANIFKLHKYQTFGLMKIYNMSKIWFANSKFSLLWWNKKYFSWFFKGFQLPEIVLDPTLRLYLYWLLKEDFCVISQKLLRATILWDIVARIWKFQLLLNSKSSNLSLQSLLKNMLKIPILDLKKRGYFFQILLYF